MATALRAGSQEIHVILVGWLVGWSKPPSESRVEGGHEALGASRAEGEDAGLNEGRDRWNLEFGQFVTRSCGPGCSTSGFMKKKVVSRGTNL